jgi:signal peptidase I
MVKDKEEKSVSVKETPDRPADPISRAKSRAAEIANTFEWLITAFALAFVFRAFVMEAFRIPTGSMADTLLGAHYVVRCTQCGYKYYYGYNEIIAASDQIHQNSARCPSCGYYQTTPAIPAESPSGGDRILVLKCIYQFAEPRQWDVAVFKNPLDPMINYIKRLVGRPGETVEIIDGDVYINGQISRKPHKVQDELWMPVYNNDYQPARPEESGFNRHTWKQPFKNAEGSHWTIDEEKPTVFYLESEPARENELIYDTSAGNDFKAAYAYDETTGYRDLPYCSDLMIFFWVTPARTAGSTSSPQAGSAPSASSGHAGASLGKYGITYAGMVDFNGEMSISRLDDANQKVLATRAIGSLPTGKPTLLRFINVDHRLTLEFGNEKLVYDIGQGPDDAGPRKTRIEPTASIFGSGKLSISHLALFRDIHYTSSNPNTNSPGRATEGNPLTLEADQFFMLGDNSPCSEDGRWWARQGKGNNGMTYPQGIVPREYLVGKALFVYWPAGFKPFLSAPLAIVPNIGDMRFIYGGSDKID